MLEWLEFLGINLLNLPLLGSAECQALLVSFSQSQFPLLTIEGVSETYLQD